MRSPLAPKPVLQPVYGAEATGVAGWLGLLWISLVFLLPSFAAYAVLRLHDRSDLAALPPDMFRSLEMVQWGTAIATAGLCWFPAWRLSKQLVWRSVEIVIAGLWLYAFAIKGGQLIGVSVATGIPLLTMLEVTWTSVALPILFAALWTAYLLRSARVARTYKRDGKPLAKTFE